MIYYLIHPTDSNSLSYCYMNRKEVEVKLDTVLPLKGRKFQIVAHFKSGCMHQLIRTMFLRRRLTALGRGGALAPRRRLGGRFGRLGAQSGRFSKAEGERFDA